MSLTSVLVQNTIRDIKTRVKKDCEKIKGKTTAGQDRDKGPKPQYLVYY